MPTKNLGQVSPSPKGKWNAQTQYANADIIRHQNTAYIALQSSVGIEPNSHPLWGTYWMLIASDGDANDLDALSQAINLAAAVINMSVSATSIEVGQPPSVSSSVLESGNLNLSFQIPRNIEIALNGGPVNPTDAM